MLQGSHESSPPKKKEAPAPSGTGADILQEKQNQFRMNP
jgi:hypothetical protein